jgi:putative redox protein
MEHMKTAQAEYRGGMRFDISAGSGHSLTVDVSEADGGLNTGFSPMELPLVALLGCIGMDVVSILRKKRHQVTGYAMSARGVRAETHPKVFTQITVEHTFTGHGVTQEAVDRALELASTRYCSVSAMLGKTAEIVHTTRIVEDDVGSSA